MTKTKMNEMVLAACKEHGASDELTKVLNDLTAPKVGGGSSSVEDYTVYNADGSAAYIFCNTHKLWEPVVDEDGVELFKRDDKAKNGFYRDCNEGIAQNREIGKILKASKDAVMADVLEGIITGPEGKAKLEEIDAGRVTPERTDGLGDLERPTV